MKNKLNKASDTASLTAESPGKAPAMSSSVVMYWDGGERAITPREKTSIEEHRASCFSIPLVPFNGHQATDLVALVTEWRTRHGITDAYRICADELEAALIAREHSLARTVEEVKAKLHPNEWSILLTGIEHAFEDYIGANPMPDGWAIKQTGGEVLVTAPPNGPGGMLMPSPGRSLESRLLYALASDLIGMQEDTRKVRSMNISLKTGLPMYDQQLLACRFQGMFLHPDVPQADESTDLQPLIAAQGYEATVVWGENYDGAFSEEALKDGGDAYFA